MWVEISSKTLHATYQDGISFLNTQLEHYYKANPGLSPIRLTLAMIKPTDGSHPTLKCKAAQCRHLAPFGLWLAYRHSRIGLQLEDENLRPLSNEYQRTAVDMAVNLVGYHESCAEEPFNPADCTSKLLNFLKAFNDLRLIFRTGLPLNLHASAVFAPRPKFHMLEHLALDKIPMYGSPRLYWCYADEDFVGLIKRIAWLSRHPRSFERVLLMKYRLRAHLHAVALEAAGL